MVQLGENSLEFSFPEVHEDAKLKISFQRTFRIPDDDKDYPLPPGLGRFPLRRVDDFSQRAPGRWVEHGGIMLPMYQSEALWLYFEPEFVEDRDTSYRFAIKVAAGKMDAVTGKAWTNGLHTGPQDYMVAPKQPWLDGYCVKKGVIRQFVAMPLGSGYSVEEQLTGEAEHGGLQIAAYPMKREVFLKRYPVSDMKDRDLHCAFAAPCMGGTQEMEMGLAPGGQMKQQIYRDPYDLKDWDLDQRGRCFVHICNSMVWRGLTSEEPPTTPPTAKEYNDRGLPWFDYYDESALALPGGEKLGGIKSVVDLAEKKGDTPLPENEPVDPGHVINLEPKPDKHRVRDGSF